MTIDRPEGDTWWQSLVTCESCHNANLHTNGEIYTCPQCDSRFVLEHITGTLKERKQTDEE